MSLFYYDDKGFKVGPIDKDTLFKLAERGTITPETRLTNGKDRETTAKKIPNLKFVAPEYYRAEEIFDPKNYSLDSPPEAVSTPLANKPESVETKDGILPKKLFSNRFSQNRQTNTANQTTITSGYFYLTAYQKIFYFLANAIWYCGFAITIIATIMSTINPAMMFPVFLIGTFLTVFFSVMFGFIADFIQWLFNIEDQLKQTNTSGKT